MQPTDTYGQPVPPETGPDEPEHQPLDLSRLRLRLAWILSAVLVLVSLLFIPPLINVSRFQRRITSNLSAALGRPVHLDRVRLSLLPLPGFTLENFVVDEDPAFGYEPILRANQVRATVRISSLWSNQVEFSRITLTEPTSVNLVRLPGGPWNFEAVLIQASRIEAAPTSQAHSGPAPRFPYIEASGARLNFKLGSEKIPLALTDSDFAFWLPETREWHFRLQAHPARTDVAPADAGLLRLEGTLGGPRVRAASLAEVPIDVRADWQTAPLAGLSRIAFARDLGVRGTLTLNLHLSGTAGQTGLAANLRFAGVRRSEFVPTHLLGFEATCQATATNQFQSFNGIECRWPPATSSNRAVLIASGSLPDVHHLESADLEVTIPALPASTLLDWLEIATPHPPAGFNPSAVLAGSFSRHPGAGATGLAQAGWSGELELSGESLQLVSGPTSRAIPLGDVLLRSTEPPSSAVAHPHRSPVAPQKEYVPGLELLPITIPLGGRTPASLEGRFDWSGYTLRLGGAAEQDHLLALARAVPQFGEGLSDALAAGGDRDEIKDGAVPVRLDLTATRVWGHPQIWSETPSHPGPRPRSHKAARRNAVGRHLGTNGTSDSHP